MQKERLNRGVPFFVFECTLIHANQQWSKAFLAYCATKQQQETITDPCVQFKLWDICKFQPPYSSSKTNSTLLLSALFVVLFQTLQMHNLLNQCSFFSFKTRTCLFPFCVLTFYAAGKQTKCHSVQQLCKLQPLTY